MKPKLKPPATKRVKLNVDMLLSNSAFKFDLRRYNKDVDENVITTLEQAMKGVTVAATMVWRCRLPVSKPVL